MNLLQMSFTGAVMVLAVTVIRALAINKVPKKTFLVLWGIALVRLMIPFSLPSWFSIYSLWNREMPTEGMNTTAGMLIPVIPGGSIRPPYRTILSALWRMSQRRKSSGFLDVFSVRSSLQQPTGNPIRSFKCPCLSEMMGLRSGWKLIQQNEPLPCANPVWYLLH